MPESSLRNQPPPAWLSNSSKHRQPPLQLHQLLENSSYSSPLTHASPFQQILLPPNLSLHSPLTSIAQRCLMLFLLPKRQEIDRGGESLSIDRECILFVTGLQLGQMAVAAERKILSFSLWIISAKRLYFKCKCLGSYPRCRTFSQALLTQIKLWVALNRAIIKEIPLLFEYPPELPNNFLKPLLLPTLNQMRRLQAIEQYLQERIDQARYSHWSLFKFVESGDTFTVCYFDTDSSLLDLRSNILLKMIGNHDFIRRQCHEWNAGYNWVTKLAGSLSCTYVESYDCWGNLISQHSSSSGTITFVQVNEYTKTHCGGTGC